MRILQLVYGLGLGGTERQLVLLDRLLRDCPGLAVELGALRLQGGLRGELENREPRAFELPVRSLYGMSFWRQVAVLRRRLQSHRIDLVHSHDVYANWLNVAATRGTRTRSLVSQRNLQQPETPRLRLLQRLEIAYSDHVLVNSPAIARRLTSRGVDRSRITVVANAVEMRELESRPSSRCALISELGLDASAQIVGMVANFRKVKDHDLLIDAAVRCGRERPGIRFLLIGDGEERPRIERRVSLLGLRDVVRFLGPRLDGPALASAFDVAVLCSREEGLPNALLEAMAAGTPVVATAAGGVGGLVEDGATGWLVAERSAEALAAAILHALDPDGPGRRIAERARERVALTHSPTRLREDTVALYRVLASGHVAPSIEGGLAQGDV